ncbi:hypothetical protein [Membranihabitans maritimus]|uniref:hypothetical protein n=1 Tax=Membranihabitans maritimus TaxID=2904244 RepID=UPI001F43654E|nr:hypothetical protein [Membranihabitans maritimus]
MTLKWLIFMFVLPFLVIFSCSDDDGMNTPEGKDPDTAEEVSIDRFSETAATLMVRTEANGLPKANEPIDYDQAPFITTGLGREGEIVEYYNFDVQPLTPAPIYVFFKEGSSSPVEGQLNVINVVPGDNGYNDFWQVFRVTVPGDYVANTISSMNELNARNYNIEALNTVVNCPVVPKGSTATKRMGDESSGLVRGWYKGQIVYYFNFSESSLEINSNGEIPVSPIFVTFNINPGEDGGGPASGFVTEEGTVQTHNVLATIPQNTGYSPLWAVRIYDNSGFGSVMDLGSAQSAPAIGPGPNVNCPVVNIQ